MKKLSKRLIAISTIIVFLISITLLGALYYLHVANHNAKENSYTQLADVATEQATSLRTRVEDQYDLLDCLSEIITANDILANKQTIVNYMSSTASQSSFLHIGFFDNTGNGYLNNGSLTDISDRTYFKEAMKGNRSIDKIDNGKLSSSPRLIQAVPVSINGKVIGILMGSYSDELFRSLLNNKSFSGHAVTFLCDSNGNIIVGSNSEEYLFGKGMPFEGSNNIIDSYSKTTPTDVTSFEQFKDNFKNGINGVFGFKYEGYVRNIIYSPIGINGWYIIDAIPAQLVQTSMKQTSSAALIMLIFIALSSIIAIIFILWQERINRIAMHEEQDKLRIRDEEYRIAVMQSNKFIARYNLHSKTFYLQRSSSSVSLSATDYYTITEQRIREDYICPENIDDYTSFLANIMNGVDSGEGDFKIRLSLTSQYSWFHADYNLVKDKENKPIDAIISYYDNTTQRKLEIAYELWTHTTSGLPLSRTLIYEYNLTNDQFDSVSGQLNFYIDLDPSLSFDQRTEAFATCIEIEDRKQFLSFLTRENLLSNFYVGINNNAIKFRAKVKDTIEEYHWINLTVRMAEYPRTHEVKVFLIYEDVNEEMINTLKAKELSEEDGLTGSLNRVTFISKTKEILENHPQNLHAIIMIDIDNFKKINDTFGHMRGDQVLSDIGHGMQALLRKEDLIGRMGGDEFMICLTNIPTTDVINRRAEIICQFLQREISDNFYTSGSLGISIFPKDGTTFSELYESADLALYKAKLLGKNKFVFYKSGLNKEEILIDEAFSHSDDISTVQLEHIIQLSGLNIFDVDVTKNKIAFSTQTYSQYALPGVVISNLPNDLIESGMIHRDSIDDFTDFYGSIASGNPEGHAIIKAKKRNGEFVLVKLSYKMIYQQGVAVRAIGIIQ